MGLMIELAELKPFLTITEYNKNKTSKYAVYQNVVHEYSE